MACTYGTGPDRQYVGANILDESSLDRFAILDVPEDEALERALALAPARTDDERVLVLRWVETVRACWNRAQDQRLPLLFGQRAIVFGARALCAGISWDRVVASRPGRGIRDDLWAKVHP